MNLMGIRTSAHGGWLAPAVLVTQGCRGGGQPAADSQERLNLISNPSMYLETDGFAFDDEASDYEQLMAMTVWNKSRLAVQGLEGDVIWLDDEGHRLGSSRFALSGPVPALGSRSFSIA